MKIYTIGFAGKTRDEFFQILHNAGGRQGPVIIIKPRGTAAHSYLLPAAQWISAPGSPQKRSFCGVVQAGMTILLLITIRDDEEF
jgi:hypothetical protein